MKKVAIMTWYNYTNFGTVFQAVALFNTVLKLGYYPMIIHYIPHQKLVTRKGIYKRLNFYGKMLEEMINKYIINQNLIKDEKRDRAFESFLNRYVKLTVPCKTDSELFRLNEEFDAFICGSDQIWAPTLFNSKYFLDFVQDENKMISYAPSIGLPVIEDKYVRHLMKQYIGRFKHLSVREEQGKYLIQELCGKEAIVVLDPTLLLTTNEWNNMTSYKIESDPYILCYFLGTNSQSWRHINILSKKTGLSVKIIPIFNRDFKRGYEAVSGVGPAEFLGLIRDATFVCTDSLHGTIFSILYRKPFYVYERFSNKDWNNQNSRIYNLLKMTGLEHRLVKDTSKVEDNPLDCDFTDAHLRIDRKRDFSLSYLENSLRESTESSPILDKYIITNTCCGCGTCNVVCKQGAIEFKRDENGFLRAFVIQDKCVKCGVCKKICPFNGIGTIKIDKEKHKLFMAYSKQIKVLKTSSSGGIGYEVAKLLCECGYDVIGCTYDKENREAVHKLVSAGEIEKLYIFQGSKYLQSNIGDLTKELADDVVKKAVIFGLPCQICGIDRLLKMKSKRESFVLVDLICHGVPSQNLWEKYIKEGAEKYGYGVKPEVIFRYKPKGWRKKYIKISGNGKTYIGRDNKDLFYRLFLLRFCSMSSCYECNFRTASAADIRMGDYWGPRFKSNKNGVSMVITMTSRGEEILQELYKAGRIELKQTNCEEYWIVQYPQNPIKPVFYDELMEELRDDSIPLKKIVDKYCREYEFSSRLARLYGYVKRIYKLAEGIFIV